MTGFRQFIHGKPVGEAETAYKIMARSQDLPDDSSLFALIQKNRFWGGQAPSAFPLKAVGLFVTAQEFVLVQASSAIAPDQQPALNGNSEFNQHRYVLIPKNALSPLQGQFIPMLLWLWNQPLPPYATVGNALPLLEIPLLDQSQTPLQMQEVMEEVESMLSSQTGDSRSQMLGALEVLIQGKQLAIGAEEQISKPEIYFKCLLSLLPVNCRSELSIAIGSLDEQKCSAQLMFKTHEKLRAKLPEDVIGIKSLSSASLESTEASRSLSLYSRLIQTGVQSSTDRLTLLQSLNDLDNSSITIAHLNDVEVWSALVPLLPKAQQPTVWQECWSGLEPEQWSKAIPLLHDSIGKKVAWQSLLQSMDAHSGQVGTVQSSSSLLHLLQTLSDPGQWIDFLEDLMQQLTLAELLLEPVLAIAAPIADISVADQLRSLGFSVVRHTAPQTPGVENSVAQKLNSHPLFQEMGDRFRLWASTLVSTMSDQSLINLFQKVFIDLFPTLELEQWHQSRFPALFHETLPEVAAILQAFLERRAIALSSLPRLATLTELDSERSDRLYSLCLKVYPKGPANIRDFLVKLLEQVRSDESHLFSSLQKTRKWIMEQDPLWVEAIDRALKPAALWDDWERVAQLFYPESLKEQIQWLDRTVGAEFPIQIVQQSLTLVVDQTLSRLELTTSQAWRTLEQSDIPRLINDPSRCSLEAQIHLSYCLRDKGQYDGFIDGLLHSLVEGHIAKKRQPDPDLVHLLINPLITQTFQVENWLSLTRLRWRFQIERCPQGLPVILEQHQSRLTSYAQAAIATYTDSERIQTLLLECKAFELQFDALQQILLSAKPESLTIPLMMSYGYFESGLGHPHPDPLHHQMMTLLLKVPVRSEEERSQVINILAESLTHVLQQEDFILIHQLRSAAVDQALYNDALKLAMQVVIPTMLSALVCFIANIQSSLAGEDIALCFTVLETIVSSQVCGER